MFREIEVVKGDKMVIEKMKIKNFKRFKGEVEINYNSDFNVIIGNNESGKSSILQAIDLVLSGNKNKIENIGLDNLFNTEIIDEFMNSDRDISKIPEIFVELYLNDTGNMDLSGNNNSEKRECDGLVLKIQIDEEFVKIIDESLRKENAVFPFEYYKCIFKTFADDSYNNYKKPVKHIVIDESNLSNDYYIKEYISDLYSSYADETTKNLFNNEFRKLKKRFEETTLEEMNKKVPTVNFGLTNHSKYSLENNLTLYEQGINIWNKGSGSICMLKIKTSVDKQSENIDLVLIEEPENHLSDINMKKMINDIVSTTQKQTFISTHNSMICSRLDLRKIVALSNNKISTTEFRNIPKDTANFFIKCPSNSILNFILSDKSILVEGSAEYVLFEKFYKIITGVNPSEDNVNIISVNNLGFKRYLEVATNLNKKVVVITDNDKNYKSNITEKYKDFKNLDNISIFSDENEERYTFEVCIYNDNIEYINNHKLTTSENILEFMLREKAEVAFRLLEHLEKDTTGFKIPSYIEDAIKWIRE